MPLRHDKADVTNLKFKTNIANTPLTQPLIINNRTLNTLHQKNNRPLEKSVAVICQRGTILLNLTPAKTGISVVLHH